MSKHALRAVLCAHGRAHGPVEPVYAVCVCGHCTDEGSLAAVATLFDAHTDGHGAPRSKAPWRP